MNFTEKEGVRRHKKLRENMAEANIDVLVVYGNNGRMGIYSGNLAYVSNFISFSGLSLFFNIFKTPLTIFS